MEKYEPPYTISNKMLELVSSISEKVGKISSGLLVLIVAFSLTGCGSSRDALEISDTESAQAGGQRGRNRKKAPPSHSSHLTDNPGDDNGT